MQKFYNSSGLAAALGISVVTLLELVNQGEVPEGEVVVGRRRYYTPQQVADLVARYGAGRVTLGGLARMAKLERFVVERAINAGLIPGPEKAFGRRLYYSPEQAEALVPVLRKIEATPATVTPTKAVTPMSALKKKSPGEKRREAGYFSASETAAAAGLTPIVVTWHTKKGRIKKPTISLKGYVGHFYDRPTHQRIVKWLKANCTPGAGGRRSTLTSDTDDMASAEEADSAVHFGDEAVQLIRDQDCDNFGEDCYFGNN